jgi:hypothetical protein
VSAPAKTGPGAACALEGCARGPLPADAHRAAHYHVECRAEGAARRVRERQRKAPERQRPRAKTLRRLRRAERAELALVQPERDASDVRPATRAACKDMPRPCPFVSCKFHLYLDVNPETGSIKVNFPDVEPTELAETCALDVADRGGITLEEVGEILNLTRERIRQVEVRGLLKLKMSGGLDDEPPETRNFAEIREQLNGAGRGKRR